MKPLRLPIRVWDRLGDRYGKGGRWLWLAFLVLAIVFSWVLIEAEKPWSSSPAERLAEEKKLRSGDWAIIGIWFGSLAALIATLPLLLGAKWWLANDSTASPIGTDLRQPGWRDRLLAERWLWIGVLAAVIVAGWLRAPRLGHSLWTDEAYVLRRYVHGEYKQVANNGIEFRAADWNDALFTTKSGNNHLLHTIPARLTSDAWRWFTGKPRDQFSEIAVRLVPWLCGLLTIAAVAWLVRAACGPGLSGISAALSTAWLLALHPWHTRWGVDARGYSIMLLCIVLGWIALWFAVKSNRRRWWIMYAAAQAGMLLAFPGAIYVSLIQNTAALGLFLGGRQWLHVRRLLAANFMSAIPVVFLLAASVPQILGWLDRDTTEKIELGWPWLRNFWSHLAFGIPYINPAHEYHLGPDLVTRMRLDPVTASLALRILPLFIFVGCVAWLGRGRAGIIIGLTLILAPALAYIHNSTRTAPLHVWYLLFAMPLLVVAPPVALHHFLARVPKLVPLVLALLLGSYAWSALPNTLAMREHQRQPMRQTVDWIRQQQPDAITAVYSTSAHQVRLYDPTVLILTDIEELETLLARASDGAPVFVYACGEWPGQARRPDWLERLQQLRANGRAREVHRQLALEALFSYRVWELRPPTPPR